MTKLYKWLLFISSYAPLYVLVAISNYDFALTPFVYFKDVWISGNQLIFWVTIIVLLLLSFLAIGYFKWSDLNDSIKLEGLKPMNESILSYLITYVVPLTAMDVSSVNSLLVNVVLFLVIGIVYVNSNLVYLNILLILMGYRVYNDASDNVIITNYTKNELTHSVRDGNNVLCKEVTRGIYLVRRSG